MEYRLILYIFIQPLETILIRQIDGDHRRRSLIIALRFPFLAFRGGKLDYIDHDSKDHTLTHMATAAFQVVFGHFSPANCSRPL